jgi:hypothetical protein
VVKVGVEKIKRTIIHDGFSRRQLHFSKEVPGQNSLPNLHSKGKRNALPNFRIATRETIHVLRDVMVIHELGGPRQDSNQPTWPYGLHATTCMCLESFAPPPSLFIRKRWCGVMMLICSKRKILLTCRDDTYLFEEKY